MSVGKMCVCVCVQSSHVGVLAFPAQLLAGHDGGLHVDHAL